MRIKFALNAYTLSEVLITLGIIGVVSALTIPAVIQKQNEKTTITNLKKAYSILQQAYLMAQNNDGEMKYWFTGNETIAEKSEIFAQHLKPYFKIIKDCGTKSGCLNKECLLSLDGTCYNNFDHNQPTLQKMIINNGMSLFLAVDNISCPNENYNRCGSIAVDINGKNSGPNRMGKDVFYFKIYQNKILPSGSPNDTVSNFENLCNLNIKNRENGIFCTAWVIYNENMDYLHCNDLSWNGKRKCK